ncbi:MAG: QueT transporter family protein [Lachnospiraceae bacterium]|nr:QueT transporter family protein [Lachnospiraceae bacterium]
MKLSIRNITYGAVIAAIYIVLTYIVNLFGLANGAVQVRLSEALTILPYFTASAIPGLFIGCLLSNVLTGCALPDIIFGSLATLIGAIVTYYLGRHRSEKTLFGHSVSEYLAPVPAILSNTLIIPFVLKYAYGIVPLWFSFVTVFAGEVISCGILGLVLLFALKRYPGLFHDAS